jgi:hypothetical protein
MSTISASTTTTTAFKVTSDTTGTLVLQTGSTPTTAVTIDTSGNVGIGTSSPATKLDVVGTVKVTSSSTLSQYWNSASGAYTSWQNNGTTVGDIGTGNQAVSGGAAGDFGLTSRAGNLVFGTSSAERMRLTTAGRLGIATTSPSDTVGIGGTGGIQFEGWNNDRMFLLQTFSSGYFQRIAGDAATRQLRLESNSSDGGGSGSIVFKTSSSGTLATTMTLDGLGTLGVGITPNTWGGGSKAIQLPGGAISGYSSAGNNQLIFWNNCYYGSNFTYTTTDYANYFRIYNGTYAWFNAPSGTAGTTPTFTQVMTLTNGGYLGIGTTAPNYPLVVSSGNAAGVEISPSGGINSGAFLQCYNRGTSAYVPFTTYASEMYWSLGGGAVMKLDSSGNLLVGTTTSGMTAGGVRLKNGGGNLGEIALSNNSGATDYVARFLWGSSATLVGNITVSSTATAYNTSSDYRLKSDVQPMAGALARVAALKPVTYKWNIDGSAGEGFIAHELAEVCPYAVTGEKDAVDAEGKPVYQGVDTSFLVATLAAAIQELKAEFDAYKASHP